MTDPPHPLCHSLEDFRETSDIPEEVSSHAQVAPQGGGASKHTSLESLTPDAVMLSSTLISESFDFSLGPCVVVREGSSVPVAGCLSLGHYHVCIISELELNISFTQD